MDLNLHGKTAIVTGASRGVGLATARALQAEGVTVLGAARKSTAEMKAAGIETMTVDLSTREGPQRLVDQALERLGHIDLLVNNAGGGTNLSLNGFLDVDDDEWFETFELNLFAAVRVTRAAMPSLLDRAGVVVNVSSIGARRTQSPPVAYDVAKAALTALGRGLATEFGPQGVRVVTVSPGPVRTAMWGQMAELTGAPLAAVLAGVPDQMGMLTGRLAEPEEVASLITYLLSERAANITGSDHLIDGGALRSA